MATSISRKEKAWCILALQIMKLLVIVMHVPGSKNIIWKIRCSKQNYPMLHPATQNGFAFQKMQRRSNRSIWFGTGGDDRREYFTWPYFFQVVKTNWFQYCEKIGSFLFSTFHFSPFPSPFSDSTLWISIEFGGPLCEGHVIWWIFSPGYADLSPEQNVIIWRNQYHL